VSVRVLVALELLKHERGASDEDICHRFRTDCAVMYAGGLRDSQINPLQAHFGLPETLCELRGRFDEALVDELLACQAQALQQELTTVMRSFGRQGRAQGQVFVTLVRQRNSSGCSLVSPLRSLGSKPNPSLPRRQR
jgi:hypothetical protein